MLQALVSLRDDTKHLESQGYKTSGDHRFRHENFWGCQIAFGPTFQLSCNKRVKRCREVICIICHTLFACVVRIDLIRCFGVIISSDGPY